MNVIFDVDGVLRGTKPVMIKDVLPKKLLSLISKELYTKTIREYFHLYPNLECLIQWDLGLITADEVVDSIASIAKEPREVVDSLLRARLNSKYNYVYNETIDFAKKCKSNGNKIYILSNLPKEVIKILPELFDTSIFDGAIFSSDIGLRKPDPEFYAYALDKWGIRASNSIFIDDRKDNLNPFERLGGKVVLFSSKALTESLNQCLLAL